MFIEQKIALNYKYEKRTVLLIRMSFLFTVDLNDIVKCSRLK